MGNRKFIDVGFVLALVLIAFGVGTMFGYQLGGLAAIGPVLEGVRDQSSYVKNVTLVNDRRLWRGEWLYENEFSGEELSNYIKMYVKPYTGTDFVYTDTRLMILRQTGDDIWEASFALTAGQYIYDKPYGVTLTTTFRDDPDMLSLIKKLRDGPPFTISVKLVDVAKQTCDEVYGAGNCLKANRMVFTWQLLEVVTPTT